METRGLVAEFEGFLSRLEEEVWLRYLPGSTLIVSRDFNSKFLVWGSRASDPKCVIHKRFVAALDLEPENVGSVPTFAVKQ